jgi:hypothetical protein
LPAGNGCGVVFAPSTNSCKFTCNSSNACVACGGSSRYAGGASSAGHRATTGGGADGVLAQEINNASVGSSNAPRQEFFLRNMVGLHFKRNRARGLLDGQRTVVGFLLCGERRIEQRFVVRRALGLPGDVPSVVRIDTDAEQSREAGHPDDEPGAHAGFFPLPSHVGHCPLP